MNYETKLNLYTQFIEANGPKTNKLKKEMIEEFRQELLEEYRRNKFKCTDGRRIWLRK